MRVRKNAVRAAVQEALVSVLKCALGHVSKQIPTHGAQITKIAALNAAKMLYA